MKKRIWKQVMTLLLITTVLTSFTACSTESALGASASQQVDVILWNTQGDSFPELSGMELMEHAAKTFKDQSKITVNLITIEASNQEEFFIKREELLASTTKPTVVLFSTIKEDELKVIEGLKENFLPLSEVLGDTSDVFDGLRGDHYSALALMVYGRILNNTLIDELGFDGTWVVLEDDIVDAIYLEWAKQADGELNLMDYHLLMHTGLAKLVARDGEKVRFNHDGIIDKIGNMQDFVEAFPKRDLDKEDVVDLMLYQRNKFSLDELGNYFSISHKSPIASRSRVFYNAFELRAFSKRINTTASGAVVGFENVTHVIGFGVLDNSSKDQEQALAFAQFLLSREYQDSILAYSSKSPSMSSSVLKSVHAYQLDLARSKALKADNEPIDERVIEAYTKMGTWFNEPGMLYSISSSTDLTTVKEALIRIVAEQIWGTALSEEELRVKLQDLENQLNQ